MAYKTKIFPATIDYSSLTGSVAFGEVWRELFANKRLLPTYYFVFFLALCIVLAPVLFRSWTLLLGFIPLGIFIVGNYYYYKKFVLLRRFALANNLAYLDSQRDIGLNGVVFGNGHSRTFTGGLADPANRWLIGNYQYTLGSGKNSRTYDYGVIRLKLPRKLPNVLLDATANNFFVSNLNAFFDSRQKLTLEGDFNTYFSVYCPVGYGRDTLYFLTPELMAQLIDKGKDYDFEVIDDTLLIYGEVFDFSTGGTQATLEQAMQLADHFLYEFTDNTEKYTDTRIEGAAALNQIAPEGRRLKAGVNWLAISGGVLVIIGIIVQLILQGVLVIR